MVSINDLNAIGDLLRRANQFINKSVVYIYIYILIYPLITLFMPGAREGGGLKFRFGFIPQEGTRTEQHSEMVQH